MWQLAAMADSGHFPSSGTFSVDHIVLLQVDQKEIARLLHFIGSSLCSSHLFYILAVSPISFDTLFDYSNIELFTTH